MRRDSIVVTVGLLVLAAILLGGTVGLLFLGKPVPEFLVGFDGVIVYAAYSHGAFLGLTQVVQNAQANNAQLATQYHELATLGIQNSTPSQSIQTETTNGGSGK